MLYPKALQCIIEVRQFVQCHSQLDVVVYIVIKIMYFKNWMENYCTCRIY